MLSITNLAHELSISEKTIRRWIAAGSLKAVKLGGLWRISDDEFQKITKIGISVCSETNFHKPKKSPMRHRSKEGRRPWE